MIQFGDRIIVFASLTGLGDYEHNGIIDAPIETIRIDSKACKAALKTRRSH